MMSVVALLGHILNKIFAQGIGFETEKVFQKWNEKKKRKRNYFWKLILKWIESKFSFDFNMEI